MSDEKRDIQKEFDDLSDQLSRNHAAMVGRVEPVRDWMSDETVYGKCAICGGPLVNGHYCKPVVGRVEPVRDCSGCDLPLCDEMNEAELTRLRAEIAHLEAEVKRLREALKPFALWSAAVIESWENDGAALMDDESFNDCSEGFVIGTAADLRRAAQSVKEEKCTD